MEYLQFIRLDVICAVLFLAIVIKSTIRNQAKSWLHCVCLILSVGIIGVCCYLDLGGIFGKVLLVLNKLVVPAVAKLFGWANDAALKNLVAAVAFVLICLIVDLVITLFSMAFGAGERGRYRKYPSYATIHKPFSGFVAGLFKGLVCAYLVYFVGTFIFEFAHVSLEGDFIHKFVGAVDPILPRFKELFTNAWGA